jgi:predicted lipid-binding transport protein (Tim44 family)
MADECEKCGAELDEGAQYCPQCAAPISAAARQQTRDSLTTKGLIGIVVAGVLGGLLFGLTGAGVGVLGVLVWIVWEWNRGDLW